MAQVVKLKRTSVQGRVPTISNLELGELAINTHDGRIFFEKDNGELSIQEILTTNSSNSGSFNLHGAISASSLSISGDTNIGGNLTLGGNITIGDETTDSINITAEFSGSLLPDGNEVYDLGSSIKKWNNIWVKDVNATNINSTTSIKTPFITGSLLRLSENGNGLRMTNIGAFDKDTNNNFLIFSNKDLVFSTDGDSGVALTLDETTKDANFVGAVTASSFSTPLLEITSESVVRGYINADEFGTYIISDGGIGLYTADGTDGVVIASDGDTTIYGSLTLQTIPLEATAVNAMVVGVGNTVSYRPLGSNAFSSENFLSVNGDSVLSGSSQVDVTQTQNYSTLVTTGSNTFNGNQTISGSLSTSGSISFEGLPWPSVGSESHIIKTQPYTLNLSSGNRSYEYAGISLEHFETDDSYYHNSILLYSYDNHDNANYGSELNVGPLRNHMRVYPSSSLGLDVNSLGNVSVEDLEDGTTRALLYANDVQIGGFNGDTISLGNSTSINTISGSNTLIESPITSSTTIQATKFYGDGSELTNLQVSSSISEVATVTSSFDNQSSVSVSHPFDSKNIIVSVYDTNYSQLIPQSVTLTDNDTVDILLSDTGSGHVVLAKGGHIVSGSYTVVETATIDDTFTNQTSYTVNHTFETKNVFVSVYGTNDEQIIPALVSTPTTSSVELGFDNPTSGRVIIGKAGHIVSSSLGSYRVDVSGASTYAVSHSLNEDYPFVQAWNTDTRKQEQPLDVESTSPSSLTVTFSGNFTGKIIVKK